MTYLGLVGSSHTDHLIWSLYLLYNRHRSQSSRGEVDEMSRFSGKYHTGAMDLVRMIKRTEAEERNAKTPEERRRSFRRTAARRGERLVSLSKKGVRKGTKVRARSKGRK